MLPRSASVAIRFLLSIAIVCPPLSLSASNRTSSRFQSMKIDYSTAMKGDPLWDNFVAGKWSSPKFGPFQPSDPLLDQDPYFLRAQRWTTVNGRPAVQVPGLSQIFENEEFVFLKSDSTKLFSEKAVDASAYGEGLFFIDKSLLAKEIGRKKGRRPVPVFYLPLEGEGWTSAIAAVEVTDTQVLAFKNTQGEDASFDIEDIRILSRIYQNNLIYASISVLKSQTDEVQRDFQRAYREKNLNYELPFVYPAPGSTAVFGTFFTGVGLSRGGKMALLEALFPTAHAESLLTPDVVDRLIIVGQITGAVFVTSVLSKYTVLKERNRERRAHIESEEDRVRRDSGQPAVDRSTLRYRAIREGREWIDYFSHGLSTISSAIGTAAGFILEYGADRLWRPDSKINRGVRKFLEYTFIYNRKQNENVLVNAQTFFLGVLILGGIDTAGVVLQLLWVSPVFFPWVAGAFGEQIQNRVAGQFSGQDAALNNVITSEIMRNLTAYGVSGAYAYSSEQRQKIMEDLKPTIENQMRREGLNPYDPRNESELNRRMEAVIERMLVERGLPSRKEFLFGSPTVVRALAHLMGYKVDRQKLGIPEDDQFVLEKARWGLISHALKRSQKAAQEIYKVSNNPQVKQALEVLKDTKQKYSVFTRMITRPMAPVQNVKEAYEIRKMLTVLSYEGDVLGGSVKYLDVWKNISPDPAATLIAAKLFRQALFSLVHNKPYILMPEKQDLEKYYAEAKNEVEKLAAETLNREDTTITDKEILRLELVKKKIVAAEEAKSIQEWKPEMDVLERAQMEKAHVSALYEVTTTRGNFDPKAYREAYRRHMSRLVGLHDASPENSDLVRLATEAAAAEAEGNLKSNPGMARYFSELNGLDKIKYASHLYAVSYLDKYMAMTVSNSSIVSLTSPEQPGVLQGLRKTKLFAADNRLGRFLTGVARTIESPMAPGAYGPGISNMLKRYIPFWGDFSAATMVKIRQITGIMTVGYLGNVYLWQVKFPWDTYLFFTLTGVFTAMSAYLLDRIMVNNGIRPMDTIKDKVKYSMIYTWISYPTYIPFFFFLDDWEKLSEGTQQAVKSAARVTWEACQKLLSGG